MHKKALKVSEYSRKALIKDDKIGLPAAGPSAQLIVSVKSCFFRVLGPWGAGHKGKHNAGSNFYPNI